MVMDGLHRAMWAGIAVYFGLFLAAGEDKEMPPYPPSGVIKEVVFDFSSRVRNAPGSDNWPTTWADDDHLYTAWGDGGGFGGTNEDGRVSLGVARVEGDGRSYAGYNVWGGKDGQAPAQFEGKSYGILCVGATLYMWVSPGSGYENYREARLAHSEDHGRTWGLADWAFTEDNAIIMPAFCQFGKNYEGARDTYVYALASRLRDKAQPSLMPNRIDLMRVPKDRLMDRASYVYFAGMEKKGTPVWTNDIAARVAVFEDAHGSELASVSYNPGLSRYLLCTQHGQPYQGNLGIFEGPQPWGPWATVGYYRNWGGFGSTFFWQFPTKWVSGDGLEFTLAFSGTGDNDAWNTVRGKFALVGSERQRTPDRCPKQP